MSCKERKDHRAEDGNWYKELRCFTKMYTAQNVKG